MKKNTVKNETVEEICVLLIGPPGAGKGTHAPKMSVQFSIPHLSTGDMLRTAISSGTELGKQAKSLMDAGKLVSDDVVNKIVFEALTSDQCKKGFILDGYPRTTNQTLELDKFLKEKKRKITHVIQLKIDDGVLTETISGRLVHKASGRSYHVKFNPPKVQGKDDITGEPLIRRADDNPDSLVKRLEEFHKQTEPVLQHYEETDSSIVHVVDADCKPDKVWKQIDACFVKEE